jgi:proteic killer suppression protein
VSSQYNLQGLLTVLNHRCIRFRHRGESVYKWELDKGDESLTIAVNGQLLLDDVAVTELAELRVPPGNRLHTLSGDLAGYRAIRVNDQYRVIFRLAGHDAHDGRCTDYH